ncbi:MAG TPA: hypothetical protein VFV98_17490 [Vicinamibacterales bacterium]|nr:hypothetical protein [Vicinamibacterales bacterium]
MRLTTLPPAGVMLVLASLLPLSAFAQAPLTAPLVLTQPPSARVTALGGAWVAGRDQDVIFFNPAQLIGARNDFAVSFGHFSNGGHTAALTSSYSGGKLSFTLGWGVQLANFMITPGDVPPYSPDLLFGVRAGDAQSALAVVGAAVQYKGFKIGGAGKYATDRTDVNRSVFLADFGVARNLFGGVGAFAVQNVSSGEVDPSLPLAVLPTQISGGWSTTRVAGPLDLAFFTQLSHREDWTSPAAGFEAGYSWIEGYLVTARVGVRRPETESETPLSLGGAFTADRLTVEYALRLFDQGQRAHVVTIRWR